MTASVRFVPIKITLHLGRLDTAYSCDRRVQVWADVSMLPCADADFENKTRSSDHAEYFTYHFVPPYPHGCVDTH